MFRRPSLRSTVTTLAAAAVLVGGADLASYAATGHPLVLGQSNSAVGTTSLKNFGRGPALSLNSATSSPPLAVNSSKLVKHLNANAVQGLDAAKLEPKILRFALGAQGRQFAGGSTHFFSAKVPTGTYQVGMTGVLRQSTPNTGDSYVCLMASKQGLNAIIASSADLSGVYALDGDGNGSFKYGLINYANPVQKVTSATLVYGCAFNGADPFTNSHAVTFTLRPVSSALKTGRHFAVAKSAGHKLAVLR